MNGFEEVPDPDDGVEVMTEEERTAIELLGRWSDVGEHQLMDVPVGSVHPNAWNSNQMSERQYADLLNMIGERGYLQYILVRPHPVARDLFEVIDGEHRLRAFREAFPDRGTVRCIVAPAEITDDQAKALSIAMNNVKGKDSPVRLARLIQEMSAAHSLQAIEASTGLSGAKIRQLRDLDKPPEIPPPEPAPRIPAPEPPPPVPAPRPTAPVVFELYPEERSRLEELIESTVNAAGLAMLYPKDPDRRRAAALLQLLSISDE